MLAFTPRFGAVLLLLVGSTAALAQSRVELSGPSAFSGILDTQARSRALFTEAAKVIMARDSPTPNRRSNASGPVLCKIAQGSRAALRDSILPMTASGQLQH